MKRFITPVLLLVAMLLGVSCNTSETAYANQLKKEKKLIADYIARNNIKIIHEIPDDDKWKPNEYYELDDYCYFHLTQMGDTNTKEIKEGDIVLMRYRRYTLGVNPDTTSYWTSNDSSQPAEFQFLTTSAASCAGWQLALAVMGYTGAEGKLICPSKLGFDADASSVTPYGYDLKMKIRNF